MYALEGGVAYAGSLIQWLRDNLVLINSAKESEAIAAEVADNGNVYFVPAFAGLFAPHWRMDARGVICGLTSFNTRSHIVRSALEATAFQVKEVLDAMEADSGVHLTTLRADGGMTANSLLMQFQADILDAQVTVPRINETTSVGAAYVAGLAVNFFHGVDALEAMWCEDKKWTPSMQATRRDTLVAQWKKAVERSLCWVNTADAGTGHSHRKGRLAEAALLASCLGVGLVLGFALGQKRMG